MHCLFIWSRPVLNYCVKVMGPEYNDDDLALEGDRNGGGGRAEGHDPFGPLGDDNEDDEEWTLL